jgi:hypothetical protein
MSKVPFRIVSQESDVYPTIIWWEAKCDHCDKWFRCPAKVESQIVEEVIEAGWTINVEMGTLLCPDHVPAPV